VADLIRDTLGCTEHELYSQVIASLEALGSTRPSQAVRTATLAGHIGSVLKREADEVGPCLVSYPMVKGTPLGTLMHYVGDEVKEQKRDWHDYEWYVMIARVNEHGRLF
jgi:acyl-coenzyme A synthetase/AMP-(fatty) acid ligase